MQSLLWSNQRGGYILPTPFLVAGIVNITPDSFSDGGKYFNQESALEHAKMLLKDGADLLDIGGESTRPGALDIGSAEEIDRILPVIENLVEYGKEIDNDFAISVDTFRSETAARVLECGVNIINDVSGGTFDSNMVNVVSEYRPGYVLGHSPARPDVMQNSPYYEDVVEEIYRYFEDRMNHLVRSGLPESHIVLDPCIGFGKNIEHNLALMRHVERFMSLGRPLYYGISRKKFFFDLFSCSLENRDSLTHIVTVLLASKGVSIHRVHDVAGTSTALNLFKALTT